jgi:hypothetical protein
MIIQMEFGPAPSTIGIGPINTIAPKFAEVPERTAAVVTRTIPMKIKRKPRKNSLSGVGHERGSKGGVSSLTRL